MSKVEPLAVFAMRKIDLRDKLLTLLICQGRIVLNLCLC